MNPVFSLYLIVKSRSKPEDQLVKLRQNGRWRRLSAIFNFILSNSSGRLPVNQSKAALKNSIFHIGVILLVLATGCKKNNPGDVTNATSYESFPNTIGDRWRYQVIDTTIQVNQDSSSVTYNVDVVIVDTVKIQNGITASLWQFNYPDHADTNYVYYSGDTIKFMDKTGWYLLGQFIFPFTSGSSWQLVISPPELPQFVTVSGPTNITVNNYTFSEAWRINGGAGGPDTSFYIDDWFKDHIGFVKKYFNSYGELLFTRHNLDWSLVSYQLK
jgi:hypothetical protein